MSRKLKDLVGTKINNLEIISTYSSNGRHIYFECKCFCGKTFNVRADSVKEGGTQSCGCIRGDLISKKNRLPDNLGAIKLVFRNYHTNASKRDLDFNLSLDDFQKLIGNDCYYCGASPKQSKFVSSQKNRRDRFLSYNGIDRMDNTIGYTNGNCITCCAMCNAAKSDHSLEDFMAWILRLTKFREDNAKENR